MNDVLTLWRSPLDKVALAQAKSLSARQPCCSIGYAEDFSAMTIYNYGYYQTTTPDVALTDMFGDMNPNSQGAVGALAFIPQQSFSVHASPSGYAVPDQTNIIASGGGGAAGSGGTPFFHFVITPMSGSASTFLSCNSSAYTSGGVYFRSLAFQWGATTYQGDTCIYANMWNVRAIRCTFTDCPLAFNAAGTGCTLEQCTISYTVSTPVSTKAVVLSGQQCAVLGPAVFSQTPQPPSGSGAAGCIGISVEGAEHAVIADMQLYEWTTGIDFSQAAGALYANITNCQIECWQYALNIAPPNSGAKTAGVKVTSCMLAKTSDSTDNHAVVYINSNGGTLYDVSLIDCTVFNMAVAPSGQHGLLIAGGDDIKIIGGTYSNNGPTGGAGIAIAGAPGNVRIMGANLRPSYDNALNLNTQQYALLITGSPIATNVLVSACDMTGYGSASPVHVVGTATALFIRDCPGYNDRGTSLSAPSLTAGVNAATSATPYFGPSVILYSNATPVTLHVFNQTITSSVGIVFLPSPYDSFHFNVAPTAFTWIGK